MSFNNKTVAIIVDNPRRDLRGLTLLAYQFAKRGAKVFLVPMYQQGYDLPLLTPDIVVVNYARDSNRTLLETYKKLGFNVAVLDTEGGILSESGLDSPINWAISLNKTGLANLIDYYCFWGETVCSAFKEYSGISGQRLLVTGCPRYDLCSAPWADVLHYHRENHILCNTNFSAINPAFTFSSEQERQIFCSQGWDALYVDELFKDLESVFPRYLDALEAIARSFPERTIQIRPHPFENSAVYVTRFKPLPNVIVDGEGDILNAISKADCVVHLNCGSSVDAVRLGKVPISMEFLNTEVMRKHAPLPSRISCSAHDTNELCRLISDHAERKKKYDMQSAMAQTEPWYFASDGKASERIANFLIDGVKETRKLSRSWRAMLRGGRTYPSYGQRLQGGVSALLGTHTASKMSELFISVRQGKRVELADTEQLMSQYVRLDNGPSMLVKRARNPLTHMALSSIQVELK